MADAVLLIEEFYSHALRATRKVSILLPPGYSSRAQNPYPALYVHDAQNLFADAASYSGQAWQLDRIVTELITSKQIEPLLLVAIDHAGSERLAEFAHQDRHHDGRLIVARGTDYEEFLADELKPHIDRLFLTSPAPADNALMGSSMGGLVSLNIALRRSEQFGAVAAMSPSCWWQPQALQHDLEQYQSALKQLKLWLDIGGREGRYGAGVERVADHIAQLRGNDVDMLRYYVDPDADHSERAWRNRVHLPLQFLFGVKTKK